MTTARLSLTNIDTGYVIVNIWSLPNITIINTNTGYDTGLSTLTNIWSLPNNTSIDPYTLMTMITTGWWL